MFNEKLGYEVVCATDTVVLNMVLLTPEQIESNGLDVGNLLDFQHSLPQEGEWGTYVEPPLAAFSGSFTNDQYGKDQASALARYLRIDPDQVAIRITNTYFDAQNRWVGTIEATGPNAHRVFKAVKSKSKLRLTPRFHYAYNTSSPTTVFAFDVTFG